MAHHEEIIKNKKYKLVVEVGEGKRSRRTRTVEATGVRQANELLREFQNELDEIAHLDMSDPSFVGFVNLWVENFVMPELEPPTVESYENNLVFINRYFKDMKLKEIKAFHITNFFNTERKAGRASLPLKHEILTSIFKHAILWQLIDQRHNPMENVAKPKYTTKQVKDHYRKNDVPILFELLKTLEKRQQLVVKLALFGGLRRGEVAGIASDVLHFDDNQIEIKRSLQVSRTAGLRLKETKEEDTRIVTFPKDFMEELHTYYIKMLNLRMEMGPMWEGFKDINGQEVFLLFSNEYGKPYRPDSITKFWNRFNDRFKDKIRRVRFHDLRHSSATIILSHESRDGLTMKTVQKRLGHKDIKTTMKFYSHITEEDDKRASDVFNQFL